MRLPVATISAEVTIDVVKRADEDGESAVTIRPLSASSRVLFALHVVYMCVRDLRIVG